jgi:hypothetical protein
MIFGCSKLAGFEQPKIKADPPQSWLASGASDLLLRPDEVSSGITHPPVLEISNHALGGPVQHRHVLVRSLA